MESIRQGRQQVPLSPSCCGENRTGAAPWRRAGLIALVFLFAIPVSARAETLRGKVIDSAQAAVAEANVWLVQERVARSTKADASGQFTFSDVAVGPVDVVARHEGRALGGYTGFVMGDGEISITLAESDKLTLRILDQMHRPIAGARIAGIRINNTFNVPVEDLVEKGFPLLRSNDEGLLVIDALPRECTVQFTVVHLDYVDTGVPFLPLLKTGQDIIMSPGLELRGRVTADGKAVARARVALYAETNKGILPVTEVLSDAEGAYCARVPEDAYQLVVRHPDYATTAPVQVIVREADREHTADVTLSPPRWISGQVIFPDGRPSPAVRVAYRVEKTVYEETLTQGDGSFSLKVGTQQGLVQVIPPPGYMTEKLSTIPFDMGNETRVKLTPIRLEALPEFKVHVLDSDGQPASRAFLSSLNLAVPYWNIADADGNIRFRLGELPPDAVVRFRVEHRLRFQRAEFDADPRNANPIEVRLAPFEPDLSERSAAGWTNNLSNLVGKKAPEFKCDAWFNTEPLSLADLAGKVVVLTFWGSFDDSPTGVNRISEICALHDLFSDVDDVVVLTIHDASVEPDLVEGFLKRHALSFPVGCDADPFFSFMNYGINRIPQTVLIGKDGKLFFFDVEGRILELVKDLRRRAG